MRLIWQLLRLCQAHVVSLRIVSEKGKRDAVGLTALKNVKARRKQSFGSHFNFSKALGFVEPTHFVELSHSAVFVFAELYGAARCGAL